VSQAILSAANVLQAKSGGGVIQNLTITLDNPTQAGSTIIIELWAPGSLTIVGTLPDGFQLDANLSSQFYTMRKARVAEGETSFAFTYSTSTFWAWRITEWDTALEPESPFETWASAAQVATGLSSFSTGTTWASSRPNVVALATHCWKRGQTDTGYTFDWGSHTNGFTERDELRISATAVEFDACWSWKFAEATDTFETTATATCNNAFDAQDTFWAVCAVYAATTYAE
jgi:hypothetical protein